MNYIGKLNKDPSAEVDNDVYLRIGDAIELHGKRLVVEGGSSNPPGFIFSDPDAPGNEQKITSANIKAWWLAESLFFISRDEFGLPIGIQQSLRKSMRMFHASERAEMFRRLRYCMALDDLGPGFSRSEAGIAPACQKVAAERSDTKSPSWSTVYRWWKNWVRAGRDVRALNPSSNRKGNRKDRLPEYMRRAIELGKREWLQLHQPNRTTAYKSVVASCVKHHGGQDNVKAILDADPEAYLWPTYRTFCTACGDINRAERLLKRHGKEPVRNEMYPVGIGPMPTYPLERVESDFKYLRLMVVDDRTGLPLGTPYLMAAIDCYSGVIAGFDIGFDPPSYVSAARCLKHIIEPKSLSWVPRDEEGGRLVRNEYPVNGVPFQFFVDNDAAFHARSFEESAKALGCHIDYLPPGEHYKKGMIERFWGTVQTSFLDMFPGKLLRIGRNAGEYDPERDATVTLSTLKLVVTKALVDIHHQDFEPGTDQLRITLWKEGVAVHPPRLVRQHSSLIELVGAYEERLAERRGIALFGLRYNSPQLAQYRSEFNKDPRVVVRYDPQDISTIWIIDQERGVSFPVPCTRRDYADGLSKHQHYVIRRHASRSVPGGKRLHLKHLMLAKVELFELGKKLIGGGKNRKTKQSLARFLGVGKELIDDMQRAVQDQGTDDHIDFGVQDDVDAAQAKKDEALVDALIEERKHGKKRPASEVEPLVSVTAVSVTLPSVAPASDVIEPAPTELQSTTGQPPAETSGIEAPASNRRRRDRTIRFTNAQS